MFSLSEIIGDDGLDSFKVLLEKQYGGKNQFVIKVSVYKDEVWLVGGNL